MPHLVRASLLIGLAACASTPAPRPAVIAPCEAARVGRVLIEGAEPAEVAPLAVLEGTLDDPARTDRITAVAADLLHARGYAWAKISVTRSLTCGIDLHAKVERGPKFKISAIDFQTDDGFPATQRVLAVEDALGTVNAVGGAYVADRMQRALAQLLKRYNDNGWIQASIEIPQAHFDERHGEVRVTIPVHAGPRFRIGMVIARGGRHATRLAVLEALGFRGGEWYDGTALRDGIERARRDVDHRVQMKLDIAYDRGTIDVEVSADR